MGAPGEIGMPGLAPTLSRNGGVASGAMSSNAVAKSV